MSAMQVDLGGKCVLVTGGSGGIGSAVVRAFRHAGALVAVNYVGADDAAEALVAEIGHDRAFAVCADVGDEGQVASMFAAIESRWGGLDILVNNAGIEVEAAPAWQLSPADWRKVLDINLTGPFLCSRHALHGMVERRSGVIINVTSVHETIAWSGHTAYTASKAGLAMLTRTLAQEASPFGVRVLSLAPGAIRTPINAEVWQSEAGLADLRGKIPLGRIGEPDEVAAMAVVLASDAASYITGTTVFVDGGMTDYPSFRHGG
jgi:NAD(P)-dependent dehydrogenase (short-subunit alcohol dehydrogenase family)